MTKISHSQTRKSTDKYRKEAKRKADSKIIPKVSPKFGQINKAKGEIKDKETKAKTLACLFSTKSTPWLDGVLDHYCYSYNNASNSVTVMPSC
ncbi:hypothetical protein [Streptococcus mitis]|uniref:hypothetical protein n=1 Tax=Streptococcus mitis TaxID=28037 RepID=UPI001C4E48AC